MEALSSAASESTFTLTDASRNTHITQHTHHATNTSRDVTVQIWMWVSCQITMENNNEKNQNKQRQRPGSSELRCECGLHLEDLSVNDPAGL